MLYEIKLNADYAGRKIEKSYFAEEFEITLRNGLEAIKFRQPEKSRFTWIEIPNDYQMKKYYKSFNISIIEATTGKGCMKIER